jgi:DNA polymerase-3 subunit epsilon
LPPRITEAEAESHAAFIATLGEDAVWKRYG